MKTAAITALIISAGFGQAGQSAKSAKGNLVPAAAIPRTTGCPQCLAFSGLFVGAGVDYLFDADTAYYTGRTGYEWASQSARYSQSVFLEAGWLENDGDFDKLQLVPITVNYEYKRALTRCLNLYVGAGVGLALVDGDRDTTGDKPGSIPTSESFNDPVLFAQAFAGLTYCVTESVELYGGVRYLWTADIEDSDGLNDFSVGAGLRVKF